MYGLSSGYLAKGPVDVEHSPIDSEALSGKIVTIPDVCADTRFQYVEAAKREGIVPCYACHWKCVAKLSSTACLYRRTLRFHEDDIQFLSVLASLAALAIENANRMRM